MIDGLANWMDAKGLRHHRRLPRPSLPTRHRVEAPQSQLQNRRAHRRRPVHRLRALLHRLLGWRPPVHPPGPRHRRRERPRRAREPHEARPRQHRRHADSQARPPRVRTQALRHAARAHPARGRNRVRRLQSLLAGLPGRRLHHHGASRQPACPQRPGRNAHDWQPSALRRRSSDEAGFSMQLR